MPLKERHPLAPEWVTGVSSSGLSSRLGRLSAGMRPKEVCRVLGLVHLQAGIAGGGRATYNMILDSGETLRVHFNECRNPASGQEWDEFYWAELWTSDGGKESWPGAETR